MAQLDEKPNRYDVLVNQMLWGPPICMEMIGACARRLAIIVGRRRVAMFLYQLADACAAPDGKEDGNE